MNAFFRFLKPLTGVILIVFMAWYFSDIFTYIIISAVLSLIGRPLASRLQRLHIYKVRINKAVAAGISLVSMMLVFSLFILFIVPLITNQARIISQIDTEAVSNYFSKPLNAIYGFLVDYNVLQADQSINLLFEEQLDQILDVAHFTNFFGHLVSATSNIFMGTFIVLFLTFFFLKDPNLLRSIIMALTPEDYINDIKIVMTDSRILLTRYFLGIMLELVSMMTIISITLSFFGVQNAIIIGFLGGLMNIIPYLGPVIGASIGITLGIISVLSSGQFDAVLITTVIIAGTFIAANIMDNILLQPLIYSQSVKAHPIEIFLVIIMAGKVAGIVGMIIAIPTYTILRVVARQFLSQLKFIKVLTENMVVKHKLDHEVENQE
ncbi:MAG: AI-2E family transporter [Bacteroidetes bacterium]|nr:AI-2E family transporter [Bacteroidota bacterium]MBU1580674.1 AI-2E family transporter [Bacteroidota bacterium]MBU2558981.1 AI-2E family transporter [Bacteroidota bacterium]